MHGRHPHTLRAPQAPAARSRTVESEHPLRIHTFLTGSGLLLLSLVGGTLITLL